MRKIDVLISSARRIPRRQLFASSRAQEDVLSTAIHIVIGLFVVIALITLGVKIYKLSEPGQGSKVSFDRMNEGIKTLLNAPNTSVCHVTVSFASHEALVGFDRGNAWSTRAGWFFNDVEIARPVGKCPPQLGSCLALCNVGRYTGDHDCEGSQLYDSVIFENVSSFEYLADSSDPVPLWYYGSDGTVEQFSLRRIGTGAQTVVQIINSPTKVTVDSKPCETLAVRPSSFGNVSGFS